MDDETETFLQSVVFKIKEAIKYEPEIKVYISSSQVLNASAIQSGDIVINAGAILQCENVEELIAILAHEVGHIAGSHIASYLSSQPDFMKAGLVTMLIGATAAIFANDPTPFAAGLMGGQSMATGMALSKMRQKENMADSKAAQAVKNLKWPVFKGFVSIHEKLGSSSGVYNVYLSTHPHSEDRISKFRSFQQADEGKTFPEENIKLLSKFQKKFETIKTKIRALIWPTNTSLSFYANPKNNSEKFAKAIALYKSNQYEKSVKLIDELIENHDEDTDLGYYMEIKSMCLINMKQCKNAAISAWDILQNDKKIKIHRDLAIIYADAIVDGELGAPHIERAIKLLKKVLFKNKHDPSATNLLGQLYSLGNQPEKASLYAAEFASIMGDHEMALHHAKKALAAKDQITKQRAMDILSSEKNNN